MIPAIVLGAVMGIAVWGLLVAVLGKGEDEDEDRMVTETVEDISEQPRPVKRPVRVWQLPLAGGSFFAGWLLSGYVGLGLAAAESVILLPLFWRATDAYDYIVERDEALMSTVSSVRDLLKSGSTVHRAMIRSTRVALPPIDEAAHSLARELDGGRDMRSALSVFAVRVASPTSDQLVATLVTCIDQGASSLASLLDVFISEARADVSSARSVILERKKVLTLSKWTSMIFTSVIVGSAVMLPDIMRGYKGVLGQAILVTAMLMWGGGVYWLYHINRPPAEPRINLVGVSEQEAALRSLGTEGG